MTDANHIVLDAIRTDGWFERIERGIYGLSEGGKAALVRWADALPAPVP